MADKKELTKTGVIQKALNFLGLSRAVPDSDGKNNLNPPPIEKSGKGAPPNGRTSLPPYNRGLQEIFATLSAEYRVMTPSWNREVIPVIRKLTMINPDFGQALHNIVTLGNTGHKIHFDKSVPEDQRLKMRDHILNKHKEWASGQAGIDGMVNRMFSQIMIGGALSNEWVPNNKLTGIEALIMVNPEDIVFVLDKRKTNYMAYQRVFNTTNYNIVTMGVPNLVKLNPLTYRYYALNGDGEVPYGFPPYMAALDSVETQENMNKNINQVVDQLGLMGFLEALIDLPEQWDMENDDAYLARLNERLSEAKRQIDLGFKDGTVVGFKGQHEFKYNSVAKDFDKAVSLYSQNELQVASGLKQDASLWGRDYSSSESQMTVVFMKLLSELKNIQNIAKCNLEFGYTLELRLAGYTFNNLKVVFNKSTLQDELKYQQAQEYKIRNLTSLYLLGIIDTQQIAEDMDYENPDQPVPRVPDEILAGVKGQTEDNHNSGSTDKAKDSKNKSAKGTRDKNKPQGNKK